MEPNKIIDGIQLDRYLRNYSINSNLQTINCRQNYSLDRYITEFNTSIIYGNEDIKIDDIDFTDITTEQEKYLIVDALNILRQRVI